MTRSQFTKWLCKEASSSCKRKAPPVPKDRPKGPAFEGIDPEEAKMQKMMATMKVGDTLRDAWEIPSTYSRLNEETSSK